MSVATVPISESRYDPSEEDESLLRRCRGRDEGAFREVFDSYQRKIFNIAYRILGDPAMAEDAVQESFLNIYRGIRFFRGESKISTWINRIVVNVCLGILRKNKRSPTIELEGTSEVFQQSLESNLEGPFESYLIQEHRARVHRTLGQISRKHRTVVQMHDLEGHTISEISELLNVPAGTIKSRLFYGRREFRDDYVRRN